MSKAKNGGTASEVRKDGKTGDKPPLDPSQATEATETQDTTTGKAATLAQIEDEEEQGDDEDAASDSGEFEQPEINPDLVIKGGVPVDDDTYTMMRKRQMGAAVMFVPDLNPSWRKGPVSQRPLGTAHVNDLQKRMKHKVRRTELADRLRSSCTAQEYTASLKHTCELYDVWLKKKWVKRTYTVAELRAALKEMIMNPMPIEEAPMLVWDPALATKPQLDAGQHRRQAFLKLFNADGKITALTPETVKILGWVTDIADMDQLDDKYYRLIRANQHDVYEPDSEGDILIQLDSIFDDFLAKEAALKGKGHGDRLGRFVKHIESEMGQSIKEPKRYLQLLSNPVWRNQAIIYTSYAFGRQAFKVYHFTNAAGQFMDEFWIGHFDTQYAKMTKAFGDCKKKLRIDDLQQIRKIGIPNDNYNDLRTQWFPVKGDSAEGHYGVNPVWFVNAEFSQFKFTVPYVAGRYTYDRRRPFFLENLSDEEYCASFDLISGLGFTLPDPSALIKEIRMVAGYLGNIVRHVIFWANESWAPPANNSKEERANLSLIHELQKLYQPVESNDDVNMMNLQEMNARDVAIQTAERKIVQCLSHIQGYIHNNIRSWKTVSKATLMLPKEFVGFHLSKEQRVYYRDMFAYQPWAGLLTMVIHDLGSSHFVGVMTVWKKNPKHHDKKSSVAPMRDQILNFYKVPSAIRLRYLDVENAPYHHNDRVAAAVEKAILVEEARTMCMLLKDTKSMRQRETKAKSISGRNKTINLDEDLSEDDDFKKGSGVLMTGTTLSDLETMVPKILRDEALLLKDFGVIISESDYNSIPKVLTKLGLAPSVDTMQKLIDNDGSDYEGPAPLERPSSRKATGKKRSGDSVDDTPTKKPKTGGGRKRGGGRGGKSKT